MRPVDQRQLDRFVNDVFAELGRYKTDPITLKHAEADLVNWLFSLGEQPLETIRWREHLQEFMCRA